MVVDDESVRAGKGGALTGPAREGVPPGPVVLPGALRAVGPGIVVPSRRGRPLGVLVDEPTGLRWQRIVDVEGLVRLGILAAAAVGMASAAHRPSARVDRLSMGPGGWVSFKGFPAPKARGDRRPWWARLLRAHRVS